MDSKILKLLMMLLTALEDSDDEGLQRYQLEERGRLNTPQYRGYMKSGKRYISAIHDIPLKASEENTTFNMLCEIPRWTNAKMVSNLRESLNPLYQLTDSDGELRYQRNVFPYHGCPFNYGSFPRTYTDPKDKDSKSGLPGDGEFADVAEIGSKVCKLGTVVRVKVLTSLATVENGVADWKYLTINVEDEMAERLNGPDDIERIMPGYLDGVRKYFEIKNLPDGASPIFPFDGKYQDAAYSRELIDELHGFWKNCHSGASKCDLNLDNTSIKGSKYRITQQNAKSIVQSGPRKGPPAKITDPDVEKVYYVEYH